MDIAMHAQVKGTDGELGRVEDMILNPVARKVTYLVVRAAQSPNNLRLIPEKYVIKALNDLVSLSIDRKKFQKMQDFIQSEYLTSGLFLRLAKEEQATLPVAPASWPGPCAKAGPGTSCCARTRRCWTWPIPSPSAPS